MHLAELKAKTPADLLSFAEVATDRERILVT